MGGRGAWRTFVGVSATKELKTEVHASKEKMSKEMCDQTRQRFENTKKIVADKAVAESSLSKKEDKLRSLKKGITSRWRCTRRRARRRGYAVQTWRALLPFLFLPLVSV